MNDEWVVSCNQMDAITVGAPSGECLRGKGRCGVKAVWSTPERFRGEFITTGCFANVCLYLYFIHIIPVLPTSDCQHLRFCCNFSHCMSLVHDVICWQGRLWQGVVVCWRLGFWNFSVHRWRLMKYKKESGSDISLFSLGLIPFPSNSYDDCQEDKREDYQNCSLLCCVPQLYWAICTLIWAVLTGELGPAGLGLVSFCVHFCLFFN